MTAASETKTCSQHRGGCRPFDRHTQSLRASDEHMAALRAKAATMDMTGNDVIEMLIEEWLGWRKRGEKWKGPRRRWPGGRGPAVRPEFVREDAVCAQCDAPWSEGHVCEVPRPAVAPGSAVFMEPGGKPVVTVAVPDRKKEQR